MKLYLAGVTPSPQQNLDTFFFNSGIARLHSYDNRQEPDIWIYNIFRKYWLAMFGKEFAYMSKKEIKLYFAGEGYGKSCEFIFNEGFGRLLSYVNNQTRANKYVYNRAWYEEARDLMDLFLVGPEKENIMQVAIDELKSNMLFNYIDGKKATDKYGERIQPHKLFIDSGAFSAWTKGKVIDVDEYIDWINARAEFIDLYGQVDVIPGDRVHGHTSEQVKEAAKATWENYLYMRPKMKKPEGLLYTFHVGEPLEYLKQALEWRDENGQPIPYIALGGMVGKPMPVKRSFLDTCLDIIKKSSNPNVKVHAFGMTSFDLLAQYPITSADSTSWIMTGANGNIMTDAGIIAVSDQMSKLPEHYSHLPEKLQKDFEASLSEFGFTLDELRNSRDNRIMFNARYMSKKAKNLVYNPGPKKPRLF